MSDPPSSSVEISAGVDLQALRRYLPRFVPEAEGELSAALISGGKSNLTYLIRAGTGTWVLRRPPLGHVLPTAHDMSREFSVISALNQTDVPVPVALHLCTDPAVIGAPFYVMSMVEGVILREQLPHGFAPAPDDRRRLSEAFIDTLAALHAVDFAEVGLENFGHPQGYLERQVRRWGEQWDRSKTREIPEIEELRLRLARALPESPPPTIVHGDYRAENMIFSPSNPGRVAAVLDWEMSTLGDPLSDVGYALMYWLQAGDPPERELVMDRGRVSMAPGFLTREQLVERYEQRSGRRMSSIDFYQVLAHYKLAIIIEGIVARYLAGETLGEGFEGYEDRPPLLAAWGLAIADGSEDRSLRGR